MGTWSRAITVKPSCTEVTPGLQKGMAPGPGVTGSNDQRRDEVCPTLRSVHGTKRPVDVVAAEEPGE
jgi:hypothetical protein